MKKFFRPAFFPIALLLPFFGEECQTRKSVEIAVPVAADVLFHIDSGNAVYSEVETVDFTAEVEQAIADADLEGSVIVDIKIESVVYTVTQNSSAPNTVLSGLLRVGPENSNDPQTASLLGQLTNVDLDAIVGQEQTPALDAAGVAFLNNKLRNAIILKNEAGVLKAYIDGVASPAPPPNLDFQLTAKVNLIAVIVEEVDLPGGCSNPLE
jgi:hypothetical protein